MSSELYTLLARAKQNDSTAMRKMIEKFLPQIKKYSRLLEREDTHQALVIFLYELLHKIPAHKDCFQNDKILFSYVAKSLKHKYMQLSMQKDKVTSNESELTPAFALTDRKNIEDSILLADLLKVLNQHEYNVISWIYFYGYRVKEISARLHISPQAVNQMKNRALKKLRLAWNK